MKRRNFLTASMVAITASMLGAWKALTSVPAKKGIRMPFIRNPNVRVMAVFPKYPHEFQKDWIICQNGDCVVIIRMAEQGEIMDGQKVDNSWKSLWWVSPIETRGIIKNGEIIVDRVEKPVLWCFGCLLGKKFSFFKPV